MRKCKWAYLVLISLFFIVPRDTDQDDKAAIAIYNKQACDLGSALGCSNLGIIYKLRMYNNGGGGEEDIKAAAVFLQKGCYGGIAISCSHLGWLYHRGWGVDRDEEIARDVYTLGCDGGQIISCNNLGWMYRKGIGIEQDYAKAIPPLMKSCGLGDATSCFHVGAIYEAERNNNKATELYNIACDLRSFPACKRLGKKLPPRTRRGIY